MEFSASPHIWTWSCFVCFCSLYEGRPQLVGCQSTNHFLHETLHFSAFVFCKRWGSLWLAVSDFYYLSLVLTNHNYLSKILSRSSITLVPVEISFAVLNFGFLHIFASAIVLSLWRTLLFFSIIVFSVTFLSVNERWRYICFEGNVSIFLIDGEAIRPMGDCNTLKSFPNPRQ